MCYVLRQVVYVLYARFAADRDEFMLLGCDGLWRVFDPEVRVDALMSCIHVYVWRSLCVYGLCAHFMYSCANI